MISIYFNNDLNDLNAFNDFFTASWCFSLLASRPGEEALAIGPSAEAFAFFPAPRKPRKSVAATCQGYEDTYPTVNIQKYTYVMCRYIM
jgi:hypothetical protein